MKSNKSISPKSIFCIFKNDQESIFDPGNSLTPYARQICNTIIQIPEIQKFIIICIDAAPIGYMKCHNNFDIVQSCWP